MPAIPNAIRNPTLSILAPGAYLTVWVQNVGSEATKPTHTQPEIQIAPAKPKNKAKAPALRVDYIDAPVPYLLIRGGGICRRITVH